MSLMLNLIISSIGFGYFIYGKKSVEFSFMIAGAIMMIFPYFVREDLLSILLGIVLCAAPIVLKKYYW